MHVIDVVLIIACVSFAAAGYRQGFIIGLAAFLGFLAGGILGVFIAPELVKIIDDELGQAIFAVGIVLTMATVGQLLGAAGGSWLRSMVTWEPAHAIDAGAGALLGVVSLLVVSWFVGSALASAPVSDLSEKVKQSEVLGFVDNYMPDSADRLYASLARVLDKNGITQVFGPFDNEKIIPVEEPDSGPLAAPAIRAVKRSIVKVEGAAESCRKALEGTGFVYAPERVMTNAHVVAGFPLNGPYHLEKARIREEINARGPDIYDTGTVDRDVFSIYAEIEPGNSGGPLLSPSGDVFGVIFAKSVESSETGYALTAKEVQPDAVKARTATDRVGTASCV